MAPSDEIASLSWGPGDVPVSIRFDDPYFSLEDGLAETHHVFLDGNRLSERWDAKTTDFKIAELGFGTGLNFAAALSLWRELASSDGQLVYTAFERFPVSVDDMTRALQRWPDFAAITNPLVSAWPQLSASTGGTITIGPAVLRLIVGDARMTLPAWTDAADAWFLDGFAPRKNPEMWEPELMQSVFQHTAPNGSFATYTAAGAVRRALESAGFRVQKRPGYGRKREMIRGQK